MKVINQSGSFLQKLFPKFSLFTIILYDIEDGELASLRFTKLFYLSFRWCFLVCFKNINFFSYVTLRGVLNTAPQIIDYLKERSVCISDFKNREAISFRSITIRSKSNITIYSYECAFQPNFYKWRYCLLYETPTKKPYFLRIASTILKWTSINGDPAFLTKHLQIKFYVLQLWMKTSV